MTTSIRQLTIKDLAACMRLKEAAGWNQTEADWRALMEHSPDGCFVLEADGRVAATTTAMAYPWKTGWIGMVLTDPAYRGRGFATRLLERAIQWLGEQGMDTLKLDATHLGEALYRRVGFETEAPIERWQREPGSMTAVPIAGSYRGPLRHSAAVPVEAICQSEGAWAAGRPGSNTWYFGPSYGVSAAEVQKVARGLLAARAMLPVFWDLLPQHSAAQAARALGFEPSRMLLRMYRGKLTVTPPDVYAIAGFEWG